MKAGGFKNSKMKYKVRKKCFRRIKKIRKSKVNSTNVVPAINSRAVAVIRYNAGLITWTKDELRSIDWKTMKKLTMHRALHPQANVDRLYIATNNGERGMVSVEDCVEMETEPKEVRTKQQWRTTKDSSKWRNSRRWKDWGINPEEKEKLDGRDIALTVYEENRWKEKPVKLKMAKDKIAEKRNRRNTDGCKRSSTENKQYKEQSWQTECLTPL